jgi:hypothetical protein
MDRMIKMYLILTRYSLSGITWQSIDEKENSEIDLYHEKNLYNNYYFILFNLFNIGVFMNRNFIYQILEWYLLSILESI